MTTPRLTTSRPDRAANEAAVALALLNPGRDVLVAEAPNDSRNQSRISARLVALKRARKEQGFQAWTRVEADGQVRGYLRKPVTGPPQGASVETLSTPAYNSVAVAAPVESTAPTESAAKPKRKHVAWADRPFQETMDPKRNRPDANTRAYNRLINGDPNRPGAWIVVTIYPATNVGPEYVKEAKRRLEQRRSSFINFARRRGAEVTTRIVSTGRSVRLEARTV